MRVRRVIQQKGGRASTAGQWETLDGRFHLFNPSRVASLKERKVKITLNWSIISRSEEDDKWLASVGLFPPTSFPTRREALESLEMALKET
jgi:hypothetical protein